MTIPSTPALDRLFAAAIAYRGVAGLEAYSSFLAHEAASSAAAQRMLAGVENGADAKSQTLEERCVQAEKRLAAVLEALEFYADKGNWQRRRGGKGASDAEEDAGDTARETLAHIAETKNGEDGE
jgi:hypothetical protein